MIGTFKLLKGEDSLNESWLPDAAYLRTVTIEPKPQAAGGSDPVLEYVSSLVRKWRKRFICVHLLSEAQELASVFTSHGFLRDREGDRLKCGNFLEGYYLDLSAKES